jgi:hypothetical protein
LTEHVDQSANANAEIYSSSKKAVVLLMIIDHNRKSKHKSVTTIPPLCPQWPFPRLPSLPSPPFISVPPTHLSTHPPFLHRIWPSIEQEAASNSDNTDHIES